MPLLHMQEARELSAMRTETHFIGKRLKRIEDTRLLSGKARFLDDIQLPDMMYAVFVRSTLMHMHGLIKFLLTSQKK